MEEAANSTTSSALLSLSFSMFNIFHLAAYVASEGWQSDLTRAVKNDIKIELPVDAPWQTGSSSFLVDREETANTSRSAAPRDDVKVSPFPIE